MNLSNNSFTKIIDNFYVMATNMKKKLSSLEPNTLLKVMMKMTSPTSDGGPTSIAVDKTWMHECSNKEFDIRKLEIDKHAKLKKKQLQSANMVQEGSDEKPRKRNKFQNQLHNFLK